jgi:hypothetical protein
MTEQKTDEQNVDTSSSSSRVGPAKVPIIAMPIYSQPKLAATYRNARMEDRMDALDLSIRIKKQNKFVNYGKLDIKARKAKNLEDIIQQTREEPIEEDDDYPRSSHLSKRLIDVDPGLDFMEPEKREKLLDLYSQDPKALPSKEVKFLKFSKIDRFANNIEINLAAAGNAQLKALEAFEQADPDVVYWHIKNSSEFIQNAHALTNLERLKLRDPNSANSIKNHIDGAELISPQMKSIIESQKKLAPKYYQNSYYKRRNFYAYGNSNYSNQMMTQITS